MVYDRVGHDDKHSYEAFGLGRPRFHAIILIGTFLDFAYFSSYLNTKETAYKPGQAIVSEREML